MHHRQRSYGFCTLPIRLQAGSVNTTRRVIEALATPTAYTLLVMLIKGHFRGCFTGRLDNTMEAVGLSRCVHSLLYCCWKVHHHILKFEGTEAATEMTKQYTESVMW